MSSLDRPQLDYAPAPPFARSRVWFQRGLLWLGLAGCLIAALNWGPGIWQQAWYLRGQRKCLAYRLPVDRVVYANHPLDATGLLASGYKPVAHVVGQAVGSDPGATMSAGFFFTPLVDVGEDTLTYYARIGNGYLRQGGGGPTRTGAFLHARRNVLSEERLVGIVFLERQKSATEDRLLEINALVWRPATWEPGSRLQLAGLTTLVLSGLDRRRVRIFAGQADPADESHFTLSYELDGHRGLIGGWLDPYDKVRLQVRDGPAARASVGAH